MKDGKYVVLCVDDDQDILHAARAILEGNGYQVVEAQTAEDALRVYKAAAPDFVIVDLMMEEVDAGTNFVKELRVQGCKAPVYMLSSVGDDLTATADYTALGLDGVFQKPVEPATLLSVLKAKLKK